MKKSVWLLVILALGVIIFGCNSKGGKQPEAGIDKDLALKFLQGTQNGDKKVMYEATNLTTEIVNDNREKLVHAKQYKQTDRQRRDSEYALRISGNIDFFLSKLRAMLPKSAGFQVTKTEAKGTIEDAVRTVHFVKITYNNKNEAMRDKTGKPVREIVLHLQQLDRTVDGRGLHEFSFDSKDFEKMANRDFEVLSYF
jgi:hypothetical protein